MKRTEKIEVRVSQEEKQTLSTLAHQEGESVSGLIRGLVEKYMALNAASTKRRLPKWQVAGLLALAAFVGHGLTLIPMHLHERGHQNAKSAVPVYMVHGAIGASAFGIYVSEETPMQRVKLQAADGTDMLIKLNFEPASNGAGKLNVSVCEALTEDGCVTAFGGNMDISRRAPSVLGNTTKSGKPVHLFVQEMA